MKLKHFKFVLLVLTSLLLGLNWLRMGKADVTYTTIETLEDYCCIDDSYVNQSSPDDNYGDLIFWSLEHSTSNWMMTYFKFNLTNKPNNTTNSEVILSLTPYFDRTIAPMFVSNNSWTEESITWNNQPPISMEYLPFEIVMDIGEMEINCHINISDYLSSEMISFLIVSPTELDGSILGYSKEYVDAKFRPKIVWTYELEHLIKEPYDLIGNLIVGSIGFGVGFILTSILFIKLRRRKK